MRLASCTCEALCRRPKDSISRTLVPYSCIKMSMHTFSLLNVAITFSAPLFSAKAISANTVGEEVMTLQLKISPPIGVMADSMSAAVVPGAKLLPTTIYGPASPRILIPFPAPRTFTWLLTPFVSELVCSAAKRRLSLVIRALESFRGSCETREAWGLLIWWRSWPHEPFTFGFGFGIVDVDR